MSNARVGFGNVRGALGDSDGAVNLAMRLPGNGKDKYIIRSIAYGYSVNTIAPAAIIRTGRLIICTASAIDATTKFQIDPEDPASLPDKFGDVILDLQLTEKQALLSFEDKVLEIPASGDGFIILVAPLTTLDTFPVLTDTVGSLNVNGYREGRGDPFGKLR